MKIIQKDSKESLIIWENVHNILENYENAFKNAHKTMRCKAHVYYSG